MSVGMVLTALAIIVLLKVCMGAYRAGVTRSRLKNFFNQYLGTLSSGSSVVLAQSCHGTINWVILDSKGEQYFGILLEQIVIAVSAGLDIFPAISRVVGVSQLNKCIPSTLERPYKLFADVVSLVDAGQPLAAMLREAASRQSSELVSTALYHLAVAHASGGELARPLQELSDSFQEQLQERHEEKIQRMPVLATLPLLLIFAGMIVLTLGVPLVRIMDSTKQNSVEVR